MQQRIISGRIVPVAVIDSAEDAVPLALALERGGLPLIEVTLRTPAALESIRLIRRECPQVIVGAGTLLNPAQVKEAKSAGAQFGVSPGTNPAVIKEALAEGLFFIPGVMTPSDIELALGHGLTVLKFFPAEPAGGISMLKALAGPYAPAGVKFIPLGGVSQAHLRDYLAQPMVAAVGGSWLCERKLIREKNWEAVTSLARAAVAKASSVRQQA